MKKAFTMAMISFAKLILSMALSLMLYALVSYVFDLGRLNTTATMIVTFIWGGITAYLTRRFTLIMFNEKTREVIMFVVFTAVAIIPIFINAYTHKLRNPQIEVSDIDKAVESGEEFIHLSDGLQIEWRVRQVFRTYKITPTKYGSDITFQAYVAYPVISGKCDVPISWGYCLESESTSYTYASKSAIEVYEKDFYDRLETLIKEKEKDAKTNNLRRVMPYGEDYEKYKEAASRWHYGYVSEGQTEVFFVSTDMKEEAPGALPWSVVIGGFIFVIAALFLFGSKDEKGIKLRKQNDTEERNKRISFLTDKENYWAISLVALIVGYYVIAVFNGFNDGFSGLGNDDVLKWGGISRYTFWEQREWWRLITASLMHSSFIHLIFNLIPLGIFIGFNRYFSRSWILWFVFFTSSAIANVVFISTYSLHSVGVGASAGIMGLYGMKIGMRLMSLWNSRNTPNEYSKSRIKKISKSRKKKDSVISRHRTWNFSTIIFSLGIDTLIVVVPTLLFSWGRDISQTGHIAGLLAGVALWFVVKECCDTDEALQSDF